MVERGLAALAVMSQSWEESMPEEIEQNESAVWLSGQATIAKAFSSLLQHAWITSIQPMVRLKFCFVGSFVFVLVSLLDHGSLMMIKLHILPIFTPYCLLNWTSHSSFCHEYDPHFWIFLFHHLESHFEY